MNVLFHPDAELELNAAIENGLGYNFLLEIMAPFIFQFTV